MKVDKTIRKDPEHSIEIGDSDWNASEKAIRRRKDTKGRFDVHSSSEIPINGFLNISDLYMQCLKNDLISPAAMSDIMNELIDSAKRQKFKIIIS